jgi:hypothetical protein
LESPEDGREAEEGEKKGAPENEGGSYDVHENKGPKKIPLEGPTIYMKTRGLFKIRPGLSL